MSHKGTVILDSPKEMTFEGLMDEIISDMISRGHMNREHRESLKSIILSQHRSRATLAGAITKKKAAPLSELYSSDNKHSRIFTNSASNTHVNSVDPATSGTAGLSKMGSGLFNKSPFNNQHHYSRKKSFLLAKLTSGDESNHLRADGYSSDEKVGIFLFKLMQYVYKSTLFI